MRKDIERIKDSIMDSLDKIENEAYVDNKAFEEISDLARTINSNNWEEISDKICEIADLARTINSDNWEEISDKSVDIAYAIY